jgi:hypothetical protein
MFSTSVLIPFGVVPLGAIFIRRIGIIRYIRYTRGLGEAMSNTEVHDSRKPRPAACRYYYMQSVKQVQIACDSV